MKWPNWAIATERGDFLPILIGSVILFITLPTVVLLIVNPDRNSGTIAVPLLFWLGAGVIVAMAFLILGIRLCSFPGSLAYRLTHGRIFSR